MKRFTKGGRDRSVYRTVTIKDVAQKAGVAVGTVSRVVNNRPGVNEELRALVLQTAAELNYRPNARARSLVRNSSTLLSFIVSNRDFLHPFHSRVLQGVQEYCEEAGYFVMFTRFQYSPDLKSADMTLPPVLQIHGMTDCVVLAGTNYENFIHALEASDIPFVLLANNFVSNKPGTPFNRVKFDEAGGAAEATRYLIQLGHKHIWYIGDTSLPWYRTRYAAYVREMEKANLKPRAQTLALSDDRFINGLKSVQALLYQKVPLTAIFAGTDDMAFGAWEALRRAGLEVPRDVSLIGFDDQQASPRVPSLTSVRVETVEIGRQLARMAIAKITSHEKSIPEVLLPTKLMKRETCRPLLEVRSNRKNG
ncbi:MAG: LacI family DNA-binding transcriptional regulator [Candidatus Acidiferrales bacterium]